MTTLLQILAATLLSSILSIVLAGLISFKFLDRYMSKMLCISAGLLLTVAFTHLLPEAFEIHENAVSVGWTLLVSVLFLFCLEFALSHQHHGHVNPPEHTISEYIKGSQKRSSGAGNATVIIDDTCNTPERQAEAAMNTRISKCSDFGSGCSCDGNIVCHASVYDDFVKAATEQFTAKFGHAPKIYDVVISDGARMVE